jgi:pyruvate dehydrogenase (quinone)
VEQLAEILNGAKAVTLLAGAGVDGSHAEVVALADTLAAPIVHAYRSKEFIEWDNPFDVGMTGLIGFSSGYHAMMECDTLLMLGTDFPYRNFFPEKATIAQVDRDPGALGRRTAIRLGIQADVKEVAGPLRALITPGRDRGFLEKTRKHYAEARESLDDLAAPRDGDQPLHPQYVARVVNELAAADTIFTADVGTPAVWRRAT